MRDSLALLQFPFLYVVAVFVGLEVHGSDFGGVSGFLYLVPLLIAPLFHRLRPAPANAVRKTAAPCLSLLGVAWGTAAYRPLHAGHWDEHSLLQAALVSGLGIFSLLAAGLAESARARGARTRPLDVHLSLAALGLVHLAGYWFPFFPFLGTVMVLALAVTRGDPSPAGEPTPAPELLPRGLTAALFLWLGAEIARIACDFQADPSLGLTLAVLFGAAPLGSLVAARARRPAARYAPLALGAASGAAASFYPGLVTHPLHGLLVGTAAGFAAATLLARPGRSGILVMSPVFALGMALSSAWSAQMIGVPEGNLAFLLPMIAVLALDRARRRTTLPAEAGTER